MQILLGFFQVFKYPIYFLCGLISVWFVSFAYFFIKEYAQGRRLKRGLHKPVPQSNLLVKIFYEAPRMYVADIYDRDPDYFKYQGLVIYTGRQGQGKTVAMVRDIMMMQKEYPRAKCITNLSYEYEDGALTNWRQLIDYKNGIYGVDWMKFKTGFPVSNQKISHRKCLKLLHRIVRTDVLSWLLHRTSISLQKIFVHNVQRFVSV